MSVRCNECRTEIDDMIRDRLVTGNVGAFYVVAFSNCCDDVCDTTCVSERVCKTK